MSNSKYVIYTTNAALHFLKQCNVKVCKCVIKGFKINVTFNVMHYIKKVNVFFDYICVTLPLY